MTGRSGALVLVTLVLQHGAVGHVLVTSNAHTWRDVTPRMLLPEVEDALFADAAHGWIVTNDCAAGKARLERTTDGGRTWTSRPFFSASCAAGAGTTLDFLNRRIGWAIHAEPTAPFESLYRTRDGGVTWRLVRRRLPWVGPIAFRTARDGWLGGLHLERSQDGGKHWRRITLPAPRGHGNLDVPDADFSPPRFHGRKALLAATFRRGGRVLLWVYSTSDTGRHWTLGARFRGPVRSPVWPATLITSPAPDIAWISVPALGPTLFVTADGGRSWRRRLVHARNVRSIERVAALGSQTAVIQANTGQAFVTHNGGATWRRIARAT